MITQERLREVLHYDPQSGRWMWILPQTNRVQTGSVAGTINAKGYRYIHIAGRLYKSSRLAFFYMTGRWPERQMDHINRRRDDDAWNNLREATRSQNQSNQGIRKNNKSGFKGVSLHRQTGKYAARINDGLGKYRHLGLFFSPSDAHAAYVDAAVRLKGDFANGG